MRWQEHIYFCALFEPKLKGFDEDEFAPKPNAEGAGAFVAGAPVAGTPKGEDAAGVVVLDGVEPKPPNADV